MERSGGGGTRGAGGAITAARGTAARSPPWASSEARPPSDDIKGTPSTAFDAWGNFTRGAHLQNNHFENYSESARGALTRPTTTPQSVPAASVAANHTASTTEYSCKNSLEFVGFYNTETMTKEY